ncbi:hypothetical protein C8Q80DRAFT_244528 [Daedaleopsis nitida]|nr:hypothetical protein C8Q80DRAFT_244528 [Daedaleopsis nitida]
MGDITQASSPFDQDSADVVLRACDGVDFKVHSVILAQASPFFRSMFTLPQPEHTATVVPVLDCDEDSRVLRDILTICYPVVNPKPYPFQHIETTFRAAQKYEMELPIQFLKDVLHAAVGLSGTSALRVWALACRLQCEDIAGYTFDQYHSNHEFAYTCLQGSLGR